MVNRTVQKKISIICITNRLFVVDPSKIRTRIVNCVLEKTELKNKDVNYVMAVNIYYLNTSTRLCLRCRRNQKQLQVSVDGSLEENSFVALSHLA